MWAFLKEVHEFKEGRFQRSEWEAALSLSEPLTAPDDSTLADIMTAIQSRDILIRKDLVDFIAGSKQRVDCLD